MFVFKYFGNIQLHVTLFTLRLELGQMFPVEMQYAECRLQSASLRYFPHSTSGNMLSRSGEHATLFWRISTVMVDDKFVASGEYEENAVVYWVAC